MWNLGAIRRAGTLLLAVLLAAALSLSHAAHAAPAGVVAQARHHHHGHAHHAPEDRAGQKSTLCCFVVAQAPLMTRAPAARGSRAAPGDGAAEGLVRAPTPPPPRSS